VDPGAAGVPGRPAVQLHPVRHRLPRPARPLTLPARYTLETNKRKGNAFKYLF